MDEDCCSENLCLMAGTGTEFTSRAILKRATDNDVDWHSTDLGKPQQNAYIESFNGSRTVGEQGAQFNQERILCMNARRYGAQS